MRTQTKINWLALARECVVRAGYSPSRADSVIDDLTGDFRDIEWNDQEWAFETMGQVQFQNARELDPAF